MKIIALVPCRAGSERVPEKNTRPFAGIEGGLLALKIEQLKRVPGLEIRVITNDDRARDVCIKHRASYTGAEPLAFGSTDLLIRHVPELFGREPDDTVILWTHCTSPFFGAEEYQLAIDAYAAQVHPYSQFDSLITAERLQEFLWSPATEGPLSYRPEAGRRWPRTQDIEPVWRVDNACFMAPLEVYRRHQDRIGKRPYWMETTKWVGFDIDWPDDFERAEQVFHLQLARKETAA